LDEAIEKGCQVMFVYNQYGDDKKLHPRKLDKTLFNPYQIVASNGKYYVIGNVDKYDGVAYYRLDKISDIKTLETPVKPMEQVDGLEDGLDLSKHMSEHIYMFSGESERVVFKVDVSHLDDIVDWFGTDFTVRQRIGSEYIISVDVNANAVYYWALQYGECVEILKPQSLRDRILNTVSNMCNRYDTLKYDVDRL
jgi:predicted DNA-binding transcriptional regulator YafY